MKFTIPKYAKLPLISLLTLNMLTYYGTTLINRHMYHYDLSIKLDYIIPLVPAFIVPYVLAYVQWVVGYILIAKVSKEHCYHILGGEMIAKIMVFIIFITFPTTLTRYEIAGTDVFSRLLAFIYQVDSPTNLFPSIHCLESYICFRGCLFQKCFNKWYKISMGTLTLLVFLSTVFTKQHVVVDIFGALLVGEIGLFCGKVLSNKCKNQGIF